MLLIHSIYKRDFRTFLPTSFTFKASNTMEHAKTVDDDDDVEVSI
jgi:hypothetical protein